MIDQADRPAPEAADRVPLLARVFALTLIGALAYFGWNAIEKWPFTGWRLYSTLKGPTAGSFFAFRLSPGGTLTRVDYRRLPDAYSRAPYLLEKFDRYSEGQRQAVCEAIAEGERGEGRPVEAIHVYWERYQVRIVAGERVKRRIERERRFVCADGGGS